MPRPAIQYISSPETWRLMVAPARLEILEGLRALSPCSLAELAELLDRPADALYRHIELLKQAGIVLDAGYRKSGRHIERLVDLTADDYQVGFDDATGKSEQAALNETVANYARALTRAVQRSAEAGELRLERGSRNLTIDYQLTWLDEDGFAKVRDLVIQLRDLCEKGRRERRGKLYATFAIAIPVARKRRARKRATPHASQNAVELDAPPPTPPTTTRPRTRRGPARKSTTPA